MTSVRSLAIVLSACVWLAGAEDSWEALMARAATAGRNGDLTSAESLYRQAIGKAGADGGPLRAAVALNNLGLLYQESGRYARAEAAYREALTIFEAHPGQAGTDLDRCLHNLAFSYTFQGRFAEAEATFLRLRRRWRDAPPSAALAASTELAMADLYVEMGDLSKAEECLNRAIAWNRKNPEPPRGFDASALARLAEVYRRQGTHGKAEAAVRKARNLAGAGVETITLAKLENQVALLEYLSDHAALLKSSGRKKEAQAFEKRARRIVEAHPEAGQTVDLRALTVRR